MNIKLNALFFSSSLVLSIFMTNPAMADESNKRIEFQFSRPVQIPQHVLAPGKYVFQLMDGPDDRNTVEVFKDSDGKESLVAILLAIPDYTSTIPNRPTIHFEERQSGSPVAIDSWYYPGEEIGWEFIYPKGQELDVAAEAGSTPAPAAADAVAPSIPSTPAVQTVPQQDPIPEVVAAEDEQVEEPILLAQNEAPAQPPVTGTESQNGSTQVLPQTAGNSYGELATGFAALVGGLAALFASRSKSIA